MHAPVLLHWVDGVPADPADAGVRADDGAFRDGRGCYTTARVTGGRVVWLARHAARLHRDAARAGLGDVDPAVCDRALRALAEAACPGAAGVIRLQLSRDGTGALHLLGTARPFGPDPAEWRAVVAPFAHEGPAPWAGAKVTSRMRLALAAEFARSLGCEEAFLLDRDGCLVEGARTSLVAVDSAGRAATPPLARGGVAGLARALALERVPDLRERDVAEAELRGAEEIVALNAVRGARPVVSVDGRPVGGGGAGPWARRLARALEAD
jgi:branched-subunit amino acid aminotransferase/4-amino-4-deoxychorismate lyase